MPPIYLHRSIPLSPETKAAWKSVEGVTFLKRREAQEQMDTFVRLLARYPNAILINLGDTELDTYTLPTEPVLANYLLLNGGLWNLGNSINPIVTPQSTRIFLGDLLPPWPTTFPADVWLKGPGYGGQGKIRVFGMASAYRVPPNSDLQIHIIGTEYRVITVGGLVVQVHMRVPNEDPTDRTYAWVGRQGAPRAVNQIARSAAALLDRYTIIGWDVIQETETGNTYILEGNSCPGMNIATAQRVVNAILTHFTERT